MPYYPPAGGGLSDVVDDTTPQLGGNLDINGKNITGDAGTVTSSDPIIDVTQTWNDGGTSFYAQQINITDTASASGARFLNMRRGGSDWWYVTKTGTMVGGPIQVGQATAAVYVSTDAHQLKSNSHFSWSATTNATGTQDTSLSRAAAAAVKVGTGEGGDGVYVTGSFAIAGLPAAGTVGAGAIAYVTDDVGGAVLAFSDGSDWRRVTDRAVVSTT